MSFTAWMQRAANCGRRAGLGAFLATLTALAGAGSASRAQSLPVDASSGDVVLTDAAAGAAPTSAAGRTPTEFGVSHSGAATYRIPLWTPPGVGAIELNLALVYSSRGGGNALGTGWSLEGLSTITRCNRTYALDGVAGGVTNTRTDRFCLDGQPLKLVSGTAGTADAVYATAIESFARIVAAGSAGEGPASFTLTSRNGLVYEYGGTADARIHAGNSPTVRAWALSRVRDRVGNAIALAYANEAQNGTYTNGTHRIASITYPTTATGAGPYYQVDFSYSPRPASDVQTGFLAGNRVREPYQLDRISMRAIGAATTIKSYALSYATAPVSGRLRLTSVQECGDTTCLSPTTIAYQDGTGGWQPMVETGVAASPAQGPVPADLNGDGLQDIVYPVAAGNGRLAWRVLLATATGFAMPMDTGLTTSSPHTVIPGAFAGNGRTQVMVQQGDYWYAAGFTTTGSFVIANTGLQAAGEYGAADFDGDGLADLMGITADASRTLFVRRNTGTPTATGLGVTFAATTQAVWSIPSLRRTMAWDNLRVADMNGDGRADIVVLTFNQSERAPRFFATTFLSNGFGAAFTLGSEWLIQQESMVTMGDWNADGCSDIVQHSEVYLSDCAGSYVLIGTGATTGTGNTILTAIPADWNGDGRSDLLYIDAATSNWFVVRSTGEGAAPPLDTGIRASLATAWFDMDANGDGLTDLVYRDDQNGNRLRFHAHAGPSAPPDLATSFTDGFGIDHAPSYVPISRSNHTRRADAAYPTVDYAGPLYVVSALSASDAIGGRYQLQYAYEGARVHLQGLGFQGFAQQRIVDSRLGLVTVDETARDYPYTGMHLQRSVFQSNGTTRIRHWQAQTTLQTLGAAGAEQRLLPLVATTTEKQYEVGGALNGTLVGEIARVFSYGDGYGSPTQVQTTSWDRDPSSPYYNSAWSNSTSLAYSNDASRWCVGLPNSVVSTTTAPDQPALTRTSAYVVDTLACRIRQQTLEPNLPASRLTTAYGYDACGNLASITLTGAKPDGTTMPTRITRFDHGARCQFVEAVTNAIGEIRTYAWSTDFGAPTRSTDVNGLITAWTLDEYGRRIEQLAPDGTRITHAFQSCGPGGCWRTGDRRFAAYERHYAADGSQVHEQRTYYDGFDRPRIVEGTGALGLWLQRQFYYDAAGRLIRETVPTSQAQNGYTTRAFDVLGRPVAVTRSDGRGTVLTGVSIAYAGRTTTTTDELGRAHSRITDVNGQLRRVIDPAPGGVTRYDRDSHGNLVRIQDADGAVSTGTHDVRGFRTRWADAGSGTSTYSYNSLGEMEAWRDARNQDFAATYDRLARLVTLSAPEGRSKWTWGMSSAARNAGKLVSKSGFGYTESRTYDAIGRLSNRRITTDQAYDYDYTYNAAGTLDTLTYPASPVPTGESAPRFKVRYSYAWGTPARIDDVTQAPARTLWQLNATNDLGAPVAETFAQDRITRNSSHDLATQRLLSLQAGTAGATSNRQNLAYQWDDAGNLLARTDSNQGLTEAFTYDGMDRLTGATLNGASNLAISYTAAGNITHKSDVGNYVYGDAGHPNAVTKAGSTSFTYDASGNLATRNGVAQSWNSANLPTLLRRSGYLSRFSYGPDRQRWRQVATYQNGTETTHYVGGLLEKEAATSTGVTYWRHYVVTPGGATVVVSRNSNGSSSTTYALPDHLGSSDVLLDDTGTMVGKQSFSATGSRRGSNWSSGSAPDWLAIANSTRQGFTGHEMLDNLSLAHMNGRVYDPQLARFLSADPLIGSLGDSQSVNPYAYVGNRPLNATDPTGLVVDPVVSGAFVKYVLPSILATVQNAIFGGHNPLPLPPATALPGQSAQSGVGMCVPGTFAPVCGGQVLYATAPGAGSASAQTSTWGATSVEDEYARDNLERLLQDLGVNAVEVLILSPVRDAQEAYEAARRGDVATAIVYVSFTLCDVAKPCQSILAPTKAVRRLAKAVDEPLPKEMARVIAGKGRFPTLGPPSRDDVFVTASEDIAGMNSTQIARRLTINEADEFTVIRFPTPSTGVAVPINRTDPGFVGRGRTAGDAREYVIPNGPVPANATIEVVGK